MAELNGVPADVEQIKALALYNYGHFTSMRVDDHRVRGLSLHLERLTRDCQKVFDVELDPDRVRYLVRHVLADKSGPLVVRVTVFDSALELAHPGADAEPQVLVTTRPVAESPPPPLRVQSTYHRRELPEVKHVGLFGLVRERRLAQRNGFDDALLTDARSNVAEGATWNIGFFDGERIVWPEADCLRGVTMTLINQAHSGNTATAPVSLAEASEMRAVFATNAAVGVRAISTIDGTQWTDIASIISVLRKEYDELPAGKL
ncbi:MAG: aminotransferase class IV family protein [Pseudonocardiaceae bacterium]